MEAAVNTDEQFDRPGVQTPESARQRAQKRAKQLFAAAALALAASILFPYWHLKLTAPQFPSGLNVSAYVNRLAGDVQELEGLNHYVGLPSFDDGATLERAVSIFGILMLAALLFASWFIHSRKVLLVALPTLVFPIVFVIDLQYWLWNYGHSLDPRAPLSGAVGEFTPPVFGPGKIAQFETAAWPGVGLMLSVVAVGFVGAGLWFHRKAYKPAEEAGAA
ncbi:MAG: cytochrome C [Actinomycetia bacterium]|nr:cytochrome C [Actinomycetes bacterium]MCP4960431.1 cytochrome C [Actinomycetes bacterium]